MIMKETIVKKEGKKTYKLKISNTKDKLIRSHKRIQNYKYSSKNGRKERRRRKKNSILRNTTKLKNKI